MIIAQSKPDFYCNDEFATDTSIQTHSCYDYGTIHIKFQPKLCTCSEWKTFRLQRPSSVAMHDGNVLP